MPEELPWKRDELLRTLRLIHVSGALGQLLFDLPPGTIWQGGSTEGSFRFSNGSGDDLAAAWDAQKLVVVAFDHESERSAIGNDLPLEASDARYNFDPPASLDPLLQKAERLLQEGDQNVTAGMWAEGDSVFASEPYDVAKEHGIDDAQPFESKPDEEDYITGICSLPSTWIRIVLDLVNRAAEGPSEMNDHETALLLAGDPPAERLEITRYMLAQIGIRWD